MNRRTNSLGLCLLLSASPAVAQFMSGSDGSDGAFNPLSNVTIDLSLAADGTWDTPSPVAGQGVYDASLWVVVFKYTTIDVSNGVTVTFTNHPSGAPVVWLATGNVTITGTVSVNGGSGLANSQPGGFAVPGPGGFGGGQRGFNTSNLMSSGGFGPGGGSNTGSSAICGGSAGYAGNGGTFCGAGGGVGYGNSAVFPLIGGSGAGAGNNAISGGGGGGAGAILIASSGDITMATTGRVTADGGAAGLNGSGGSGGGIRLIANNLHGGGQLLARSGNATGTGAGGASGRIRIEATTNNFTDGGTPNWVYDPIPGPVFPTSQPTLRVVSIDGVPAPTDPDAHITTTDLNINDAGSVVINIEATGIPAGTTVNVRIVSARAQSTGTTSTPLVNAGGGILTATATTTFPAGLTEVQLKANWTP